MLVASLAALLAALPAHASFMQGETLAKAANVIAIVVIVLVPIVGIVVFWLVHILPEKIAHKRHHPQTGGDPGAVPAVAGVRRHALADRVALGLQQAGAAQDGLRHGQARGLLRRARRDSGERDAPSLRDDVARLRTDLDRLCRRAGRPRNCPRSATGWRRSSRGSRRGAEEAR